MPTLSQSDISWSPSPIPFDDDLSLDLASCPTNTDVGWPSGNGVFPNLYELALDAKYTLQFNSTLMPNGSVPLFTAFKVAGVVLFPAGDAPWQSSETDDQSDGGYGTNYVTASFNGRRTTLQLWQPVMNASCIYFARGLSQTGLPDNTTGTGELLLTGDGSLTSYRIIIGLAETLVTFVQATPSPTPSPTPSVRKALAKGAMAGAAIGALLGALSVLAIIFSIRRYRRRARRKGSMVPEKDEELEVDGEVTRPFTAYPTVPDHPHKRGLEPSLDIKLRPLAPPSLMSMTTLESPSTSKLSTSSLQPLTSTTPGDPSTPTTTTATTTAATTTTHRLLPVTPSVQTSDLSTPPRDTEDEGAFREFYNAMRSSGFTIQSLVQQLSPRRESFEREPGPDMLPDYGAATLNQRR